MNGHERIAAALAGEPVDTTPVMLHAVAHAPAEAGISADTYRRDPQAAADAHIRYTEKYGLDGILVDVDTAVTAAAVGAPVDYPANDMARVAAPLLESLDEAGRLADVDVTGHWRIHHLCETARLVKLHFGDAVHVRGNCDQAPFSLACALRGPEEFMIDLMTDEDGALRLLEATTRICLQVMRAMAATGVDMLSHGDSPAGPSMISPQMYARFAAPFEKAMADESHRLGLPYLIHICGDTTLILPQLATLGAQAVELDYKTRINEIRRTLGDSVTLFGTVDPSGVIALGTSAMVRAACEEILEAYRGNSRLVLGAGCLIPPMAPEENIREIVRCSHEFATGAAVSG